MLWVMWEILNFIARIIYIYIYIYIYNFKATKANKENKDNFCGL